MRRLLLFTLALIVAWPVAAAVREVQRTISAEPDGEVSIELVTGSVHVIGWDRSEVEVTGSIDDEYTELEIESEGDETSIELDLVKEHRGMRGRGAQLEIHVPRGSTLELEAVSAELDIEAVEGPISTETVSGDLEISGDVLEVEVETISGRVVVNARKALRGGSFETVSGSIEVRGPLDPDGRFDFETVNGEITLRLPDDTSATFSVETFSGKIVNELGPQARRASDMVPGESLRFSLGAGEARVTIESFNGRVELRRE